MFAETIKSAAQRKGLSGDDLATAVGVHRSQGYKWLRGETLPRREHLPALAKKLGVRVSDLRDAWDAEASERGSTPTRGVLKEIEQRLAAVESAVQQPANVELTQEQIDAAVARLLARGQAPKR